MDLVPFVITCDNMYTNFKDCQFQELGRNRLRFIVQEAGMREA